MQGSVSGGDALFPFQSVFRGGHLIEKDLWIQFEMIESPDYCETLRLGSVISRSIGSDLTIGLSSPRR